MTLVPASEPVTARWLSDSIGGLDTFRGPRFQGLVLGGFGALALALAVLGMFAIMAAQVVSRTHEMGIRLAIGAQPHRVVLLVLEAALTPTAAGTLVGLLAARIMGRMASSHVPGFDDGGILVAGTAVSVVVSAGLLAACVPALRASRVDPVIVLRAD